MGKLETIYSYKTSSLAPSFKDADVKKGIVTGYFASFGNQDSDGDVILKGAFSKTIIDNGPDSLQPRIKHLLNHRIDQPLGKLLALKEDNKGLYYESQIGKHTLGVEFLKMVESGLISEHSIGYKTIRSEKDTSDPSITYLREVRLWEGSSLTFLGANAETPVVGMKRKANINRLKQMIEEHKEIEANLMRVMTEESYHSLILYTKQLLQYIIDQSGYTATPGLSTLQYNEKEDDVLINSLESIYRSLDIPTKGLDKFRSKPVLA